MAARRENAHKTIYPFITRSAPNGTISLTLTTDVSSLKQSLFLWPKNSKYCKFNVLLTRNLHRAHSSYWPHKEFVVSGLSLSKVLACNMLIRLGGMILKHISSLPVAYLWCTPLSWLTAPGHVNLYIVAFPHLPKGKPLVLSHPVTTDLELRLCKKHRHYKL